MDKVEFIWPWTVLSEDAYVDPDILEAWKSQYIVTEGTKRTWDKMMNGKKHSWLHPKMLFGIARKTVKYFWPLIIILVLGNYLSTVPMLCLAANLAVAQLILLGWGFISLAHGLTIGAGVVVAKKVQSVNEEEE